MGKCVWRRKRAIAVGHLENISVSYGQGYGTRLSLDLYLDDKNNDVAFSQLSNLTVNGKYELALIPVEHQSEQPEGVQHDRRGPRVARPRND